MTDGGADSPTSNQCDFCGKKFSNAYQLGPHKKVCWSRHSTVFPTSDFSNSDEPEEEEDESYADNNGRGSAENTENAHQTVVIGDARDAGKGLWTLARRSDGYAYQKRWVAPDVGHYHRDDIAQDLLPVNKPL